jgi:predicted RecB family nuclease
MEFGSQANPRMTDILKYNEEDLAATWAVFEWLRKKSTTARTAAATR